MLSATRFNVLQCRLRYTVLLPRIHIDTENCSEKLPKFVWAVIEGDSRKDERLLEQRLIDQRFLPKWMILCCIKEWLEVMSALSMVAIRMSISCGLLFYRIYRPFGTTVDSLQAQAYAIDPQAPRYCP